MKHRYQHKPTDLNSFAVQCIPPTTAGGLEVCCCTEQLRNLAPETITLHRICNLSTTGNNIHTQAKGLSTWEIRWIAMSKELCLKKPLKFPKGLLNPPFPTMADCFSLWWCSVSGSKNLTYTGTLEKFSCTGLDSYVSGRACLHKYCVRGSFKTMCKKM